MLIGAGVLRPAMVTAFDVSDAFRSVPDCAAKTNASGVVSGAAVVTTNEADTPPTVSTAVADVENCCGAVTRTRIDWPLEIVPAAEVNGPPSIEYSPPVTVPVTLELLPVIRICSDMAALAGVLPSRAGMVNGAGVVSVTGGEEPEPPPPPQPASRASSPIDTKREMGDVTSVCSLILISS